MDPQEHKIKWETLAPLPDPVTQRVRAAEPIFTSSADLLEPFMKGAGYLMIVAGVVAAFACFTFTVGNEHPGIFTWFGLAALLSGFLSALGWWAGASVVVNLATMRRIMEQRR